MAGIVFSANGRALGRTEQSEARLKINPRILGTGPVTLQAFGRARGEAGASVQSQPIRLTVDANRPLPAWPLPRGLILMRGMQLRWPTARRCRCKRRSPAWLAEAGVKPGDTVELDGVFDAARTETTSFSFGTTAT